MAISLLEPGYWQEEYWAAGYFNENYWPHWPEIEVVTKVGGDDVPGAYRVTYTWRKQLLDLPEIERQPSMTFMLRQEQDLQIAIEKAEKERREMELAEARAAIAMQQDAEKREFLRRQQRKETALRNLTHTKIDRTEQEQLQINSNRREMRKQMKERRDERLAREKTNRQILRTGYKGAKSRVDAENQAFLREQERVKQPLTALEIANKRRREKKK